MALNFAADISKILDSYVTADVMPAVTKAVEEVSKEAVKKLKDTSPRGSTKKYYKGWTKEVTKGRMTASAVIYGKKGTYQLAHLLENGHAKRGGGRVDGIEHIKPVEEWAAKEFEKRIIQKLEGG